MNTDPDPVLVGLDWGTSSLRASLFDRQGRVGDHRSRPWGIQTLPAGGFAAAFRDSVGDWMDRWPGVPVLACGMVGSRQGWREVDYVACPLSVAALAAGILRAETECGPICIVPGVMQRGETPALMRGEETQVVGAIATDPSLAAACLCVLPGTHSKWVHVRDGKITGLKTFMTGEVFAVLRDHSLLGRPARDAAAGTADAAAAFDRGVRAVREAGTGSVMELLFSARSLWLTGGLAAADTLDYLSGLLVGDEARSLAALLGTGSPPPVLIGDAALCDRYRRALAACGIRAARCAGDTAAAGLWRIGLEAGLVADPLTT